MQFSSGSSVLVNERLSSWGGTNGVDCSVVVPSNSEDLQAVVHSPELRTMIPRGYARSYGDCCFCEHETVIDLRSLTLVESFDQNTGVCVSAAGVSLRSLNALVEPKGWALPVYPGTGFVSIGGAIANDIHGKEEHVNGSFGHSVLWFDLLLANGELRRVKRDQTSLFEATVGGIGLTGIVVRAAIQLVRCPTNAMRVQLRPTRSLAETANLLQEYAPSTPSMVAWVDMMTTKAGRGILELSRPSTEGIPHVAPRRVINVPLAFPSFTVNRASISAFNTLYFHRVPKRGIERTIHRNRFVFPLDVVGRWNRLYGRRGLYQFQCCLPVPDVGRTFDAMQAVLRDTGIGSTLAVMKWVGRGGAGMLSFLRPGVTLAMDFVGGEQSVKLIHRLHELVIDAGGTVYLAKDACLTPRQFRDMYPRLGEFQALLTETDPHERWQSDMSRRLGIRAL